MNSAVRLDQFNEVVARQGVTLLAMGLRRNRVCLAPVVILRLSPSLVTDAANTLPVFGVDRVFLIERMPVLAVSLGRADRRW